MVTFRQLEAFKAVIDAGSVVKAAEIMGLSQPAVSRLLTDLETAVGYRLFDRRRGRLAPLDEARDLYGEVDRSYIGLARIVEAAERIGRRKSTHLRIAAIPGFTTGPLSGVVARFLDGHPEVFLSLEARTRPQILDGLAAGLHDLGLASLPVDTPDIGVMPAASTECVCLVPVRHPLADRAVITARDLDGERCIMGADRTPMRQKVGQVLADAGARPDIRVEATTAQSVISLAAHGVGIGVAWRLTYDHDPGSGVRPVPFRPRVAAELAILYPASRPPDGIAAEFVDAYVQAVRAWQPNSP